MAVASAVKPRSQSDTDMIAELRHDTRLSLSVSDTESVSDSDSDSE